MAKKISVLLLVLCLCLGSLGAQHIVILHTNDVHSQMEAFVSGRNAGRAGMLARSSYIEQMRREYPDLIYLDAGDYNQGTPYFNLFGGLMEVELMNALQLDVTVLGNHEFDNGLDDLASRLKKAKYTTLCANYEILHKKLRRRVKPCTIIKRQGRKIGIIGLTHDLRDLCSGEVNAQMRYLDPVETANRLSRELRAKGCDLIICLTHLGIDEDTDLAAASTGIDLIIGGHSHTFLKKPVVCTDLDGRKVQVVQAGANGVYVGRMDITIEP